MSIHNRLNPKLMTSTTSRKLELVHIKGLGLGLCYWTNISLTLRISLPANHIPYNKS